MMHRSSFSGRSAWRTRLGIAALVLAPLWLVPALIPQWVEGWEGWGVSAAIRFALGTIALGFLTNHFRFGVLLYGAATLVELLLAYAGGLAMATPAVWLAGLAPAAVTVFFAQRLWISLGD